MSANRDAYFAKRSIRRSRRIARDTHAREMNGYVVAKTA